MANTECHTEHELLHRLALGDIKAFNNIYNTYYRQLVYFGHTLTNNRPHAEDAATEAFLNLWKVKDSFKSCTHIKRYLFLSVRHKCLDFNKMAKLHSDVHREFRYLSEDEEDSFERAMAESEIISEIALQINELPPQCRKVFSYIFFEGMGTEQVASEMQISTKNVLNQKAIAVKQIRMKLLKKGLLTLILHLPGFFL